MAKFTVTVRAAIVGGVFAVLAALLGAVVNANLVSAAHSRAAASTATVPAPSPSSVRDVSNLKPAESHGIRVLRDTRLVDLRLSNFVPENTTEKRSAVTLTRTLIIEILEPETATLEVEFATQGVDIHPRCLTHEFQLLRSTRSMIHGQNELRVKYVLRIESDQFHQTQEQVILEATYWNNSKPNRDEWYAAIEKPTDMLTFVVLFPPNRPFKAYELLTGVVGSGAAYLPFRGMSRQIPGASNSYLLWEVPNPNAGHAYQVRWEW